MKQLVLTFGPEHNEAHAELGFGELHKGYVVIEAVNEAMAIEIGVVIFGSEKHGDRETYQWAFHYDYDDFTKADSGWDDYERGELLRIGWHPAPPTKSELFSDVSDDRQWEWDKEIEVLRDFIDSRGLDAEMIAYARAEADKEKAELAKDCGHDDTTAWREPDGQQGWECRVCGTRFNETDIREGRA